MYSEYNHKETDVTKAIGISVRDIRTYRNKVINAINGKHVQSEVVESIEKYLTNEPEKYARLHAVLLIQELIQNTETPAVLMSIIIKLIEILEMIGKNKTHDNIQQKIISAVNSVAEDLSLPDEIRELFKKIATHT